MIHKQNTYFPHLQELVFFIKKKIFNYFFSTVILLNNMIYNFIHKVFNQVDFSNKKKKWYRYVRSIELENLISFNTQTIYIYVHCTTTTYFKLLHIVIYFYFYITFMKRVGTPLYGEWYSGGKHRLAFIVCWSDVNRI